MIEIEKLVSAICSKIPEGSSFEPAETSLNNYFPEAPKDEQEEISPINFNELEKQIPIAISPRYPIEDQVVAIDTTNFTLGQIPDGLVGAVRASIITKAPNKTSHSLEKYGPYLVGVTNQNKDQMYKRIFRKGFYTIENIGNSMTKDVSMSVNSRTIAECEAWVKKMLPAASAVDGFRVTVTEDGNATVCVDCILGESQPKIAPIIVAPAIPPKTPRKPAATKTPAPAPVAPVTPAAPALPKSEDDQVNELARTIFYWCQASDIDAKTVTIASLKSKALDVVDGFSDDQIAAALNEIKAS